MKTRHFLTGILVILVAGSYVFGQWDQSGNDIYNTNSGNVGIGTSSPNVPLEVKNDSEQLLRLYRPNNSGINVGLAFYQNNLNNDPHEFSEILSDMASSTVGHEKARLLLRTINDGTMQTVMTLDHTGNVGIGTTSPQSKLAVNGTITAKEVEVTSSGWPDFVFADDYDLRTLDEVEAYIAEHKHLPGIPSAAGVAGEGVALGDM